MIAHILLSLIFPSCLTTYSFILAFTLILVAVTFLAHFQPCLVSFPLVHHCFKLLQSGSRSTSSSIAWLSSRDLGSNSEISLGSDHIRACLKSRCSMDPSQPASRCTSSRNLKESPWLGVGKWLSCWKASFCFLLLVYDLLLSSVGL